jgi:Trk-type K+ transport system membrane component
MLDVGHMDDLEGSDVPPWAVKACRQVLHPLTALLSSACLLSLVGWTGRVTDWQHWLAVVLGFVFAAERLWLFQVLKCRRDERRRIAWHAGLAAVVLCATVAVAFHPAGGRWGPGGHVFILAAVMISGIASAIHQQARFTARTFHPGMLLMGSFLAIIAGGTLLLRMPRCTVNGESCSWLDAAFTSTSAVCVTGLAVQNTATYFSPTGQTVILLLIQIGGLGIMTLAFFAAVVLFEGISLHDRLLLGRMLQENRLARVGQTLAFIVGMTFICEAAGAVVLYAGLESIADSRERAFQAVFHSVSAFCNAGFSTLPDGLSTPLIQGNAVWQMAIMTLIVIGGLGALPCEDLSLWALAKVRRRRSGGTGVRTRLRIHTRLVLAVTAVLILAGAVVIYLTEFIVGSGPANGGRVLTALFHSVTTRTAGFNTVPMPALGLFTLQAMMVLMLIGGSPGGTAGGLRTTTVAVGLGHLWNQLRNGRRGMVVFHRTIPGETGARALGLIVLAVLWLGANLVVLQYLETGRGIPETKLLFELVSAFATVGLSIDLTPSLTDGSKCLLILNMFVGRIGLLTVLATLIPPDPRPVSGKPSEDILLT